MNEKDVKEILDINTKIRKLEKKSKDLFGAEALDQVALKYLFDHSNKVGELDSKWESDMITISIPSESDTVMNMRLLVGYDDEQYYYADDAELVLGGVRCLASCHLGGNDNESFLLDLITQKDVTAQFISNNGIIITNLEQVIENKVAESNNCQMELTRLRSLQCNL